MSDTPDSNPRQHPTRSLRKKLLGFDIQGARLGVLLEGLQQMLRGFFILALIIFPAE